MESSWRSGLEVLGGIRLPEAYALAQMSEADVVPVITRLATWYPEIQAGIESPHFQAEFYRTQTELAGSTEPRDILPLLIRHERDGVVALITFERNVLSRSLACRLGALGPEHRRANLALLGPHLLEQLARASGAEIAYYFATLRTRHQQLIAERYGFQLVGIVPGHDRCEVAPGQIKRVYDALYSKLLIAEDQVELPPVDTFTPHTRAVWDALFG